MDVSPFPYHGPLEPHEVRGRDALVTELIERITEHRVTALLGPRRFGKTSVLRRVGADLAAAGSSVVWVDLYELASLADLAVRLDAALAEAGGVVTSHATTIAAGLQLHLGMVQVELRKPPRQRPEPMATLHGLLDVLVRTAAAQPTTVIFDEFSSIARVDGAGGLLRTYLQRHYHEMGLVFAGSEPSMMRALFTTRAQPFYGQADLIEIPVLSATDLVAIVRDGFAGTERGAGTTGARIAEFTGGHPQRAMQLADAVWRRTAPGAEATALTWGQAIQAVRDETAAGHERLYATLATAEQAVLRLLAHGSGLFGGAAQLLGVSAGSAQNALRHLLERGDVVEHPVGPADRPRAQLSVVDPMYGDWLRRRFPL